jgi:hypothetical protein
MKEDMRRSSFFANTEGRLLCAGLILAGLLLLGLGVGWTLVQVWYLPDTRVSELRELNGHGVGIFHLRT